MATDLPQEEFGFGPPGPNNADGPLPPPNGTEVWVKHRDQMSDEGRTPPERDDHIVLPDWLAEAPEQELMRATAALAPGIPRRRYIFKSTESERVSPRVYRCRVTIVSAAGEFKGKSEGPDIRAVKAEIAARAALDALNKAEGGKVVLALKGARVLRVFESPIVVVGVYGLNTGESAPLIGACMVHNSVEQAAILATLQAADRWLAWQARKHR
ncbi:MAG: hypothetical protein JSV86_09730 [Gemmatimonadota bacterium]|nr:MAG: hypothetical protein JSV86_09730 [Gemmatimonadota bacterium]